MRLIFGLIIILGLAGCVVAPGYGYYGSPTYCCIAYQQPYVAPPPIIIFGNHYGYYHGWRGGYYGRRNW